MRALAETSVETLASAGIATCSGTGAVTPARRRLATVGLLAALTLAGCGDGDAEAVEDVDPQRGDPRVAALFSGCAKNDYYDRSVADVLPILAEKLERGARDPLVRAKEELGAAGAAGIEEIRGIVQRHFSEKHGGPYLSNALDVLKLNDAPNARELVLQCLQHPADGVRLAAIQALQLRHGAPQDFDDLLVHLDLEVVEHRHQVAITLHSADPARAEALYLDWIEKGERVGLHRYVAPLVASSLIPETARRAAGIYEGVGPQLAAHLAAPVAAAGEPPATDFLRRELSRNEEPGDVQRRTIAAGAVIEAGLFELLIPVVEADPDAKLRALAAEALGRIEEPSQAVIDALVLGMDDARPQVRSECLAVLLRGGNPAAIDRAIHMLDGTPASLQEAMTALRPRLEEDAALAERVFQRLATRDAKEDFLPLSERTATLKSLGQLPSAEAASLLRRRALERVDEKVERLRAHEWAMIQAGNTGDAGRAWLLEELAGEEDPLRRIDLLWAGSSARTAAVREGLATLVQGEGLSSSELLLACDRLVRLGPARDVAPLLKRLVPRVEDSEARLALQCLLWTWY